jgi:hypothetical protein
MSPGGDRVDSHVDVFLQMLISIARWLSGWFSSWSMESHMAMDLEIGCHPGDSFSE